MTDRSRYYGFAMGRGSFLEKEWDRMEAETASLRKELAETKARIAAWRVRVNETIATLGLLAGDGELLCTDVAVEAYTNALDMMEDEL